MLDDLSDDTVSWWSTEMWSILQASPLGRFSQLEVIYFLSQI